MINGPHNSNHSVGSGGKNAISQYKAEGKACKPSAPANVASGATESSPPTAASTPVSLSKEAKMIQKLSREISSYPQVDADRVAEIKQELANGGYTVNSGVIAQKMLLLDSLY